MDKWTMAVQVLRLSGLLILEAGHGRCISLLAPLPASSLLELTVTASSLGSVP